MAEPTQQREAVLAALEHLLAWPEMARSPQLARFLEYIVLQTLSGDGQAIKAYSIAVDVLGRSVEFDPQSDPIVRVQARRLRALIDDYYRGPGRAEPLRITLPVGRYVPEFQVAEPPAGAIAVQAPGDVPGQRAGVAGGVRLSWFAVMVLGLAIAVMALALITFGPGAPQPAPGSAGMPRPSVTVVEFQNLLRSDDGTPEVAGLAIELVTDLDQFEEIDVRYGGAGDLGMEDGADGTRDYVLTGIVRRDRAEVQYSAILTESSTGAVVWNGTIAVPAAAASQQGVLDDVSRRLSLILGSPRGPLHKAARAYLATAPELGADANLYLCRMLFHLYHDTGTAAAAARASQCLTDLPESEQGSAVALAIGASLLVEQSIDPTGALMSRAEQLAAAGAALDRAIALSPISSFIWEQRAGLQQELGRFDKARTDYSSSIQLNPANADALASYARVLAFGGNVAAAETMARDAVQHTPDPPDWYFGVPALLELRSGSPDLAVEDAVRYAQADHELGPILAILAGQRSGDVAIINRYLAQVLDVASFRAGGVMPRLRQRIQDGVLLEQIRGALTAAGVPQRALDGAF